MSAKKFESWEQAVSWLLNQSDQQDLVKACYYDRPALTAAQRFWQSDEWQALKRYFPNNKGSALDVGAGMGIATFALARDGWQTTALEPDASALVGAQAIRNLISEAKLEVKVAQEWGEMLPFENNSFNLIHARQVLHHAHDLSTFCAELYRVLGAGGKLVATREHVISSAEQLPLFLERHPLHKLYGGEHAFTLNEYLSALKKAGFKVEILLGPLESVINYAPYTEETLCNEISQRAGRLPFAGFIAKLILAKPWRLLGLKLFSKFDNRPGRLYTFICTKPGS